MDDRNLSTNSAITYIISGGPITQSPFSEVVIDAVKRSLNADIVACYVQTGEFNTFSNGKPTGNFVDEVSVTLFARESSLKALQAQDSNEKIETIFWSTVQSFGLQWTYKRIYSQEELAYYGFANLPYQQWDMEKFQRPTISPRKSFVIKVESFDYIALYHLLSDKVKSVGRYIRRTYEVNAKVYVGFLKSPPYATTHFIVFGTQSEYEYFLSLTHPDTVLSAIREILKTYDYWDVLNTYSYCPQYRVWDKLSGEEKMCLLREAHD